MCPGRPRRRAETPSGFRPGGRDSRRADGTVRCPAVGPAVGLERLAVTPKCDPRGSAHDRRPDSRPDRRPPGRPHDRRVGHPADPAGGAAQRWRLRRGLRRGRAEHRRRARGPPRRGPRDRPGPGRRHPGRGGGDHRLRPHRGPQRGRAAPGGGGGRRGARPARAAAASRSTTSTSAATGPRSPSVWPRCAIRRRSPRRRRWRCSPGPTTRPAPPASTATTPARSVTPSCRCPPATPTSGGGCWSPTAAGC